MLKSFLNFWNLSNNNNILSTEKEDLKGYYTSHSLLVVHIASMLHPKDIISLSIVNKHCRSSSRYSKVSILMPLDYGLPMCRNINIHFASSVQDIFLYGQSYNILDKTNWINSFDIYLTWRDIPCNIYGLCNGRQQYNIMDRTKIYTHLLDYTRFVLHSVLFTKVHIDTIYFFFTSELYCNFDIPVLMRTINNYVKQHRGKSVECWYGFL